MTDKSGLIAEVKHADASGVVLGPAAVVIGLQLPIFPPCTIHRLAVAGSPQQWLPGEHFDVEPDGGVLNARHVVRSLELTDEAAESWKKAILVGLSKVA